MDVIETPRLRLVPLSLEVAEAIVGGLRPPGDEWAPDYPTEATLVAASILVTAERSQQELGPWTAFQVLRRDCDRAIGGCGFALGGPGEDGAVQVTFSIVPSEQGQGFGREAVRAAVAWALRQPGVARVVAETAVTNALGVDVFEGAGMRRTGETSGLVHFEA